MNGQRKGLRKLVTFSMVATLLCPVILSSAVSAAETVDSSTSVIEKDDSRRDSSTGSDSSSKPKNEEATDSSNSSRKEDKEEEKEREKQEQSKEEQSKEEQSKEEQSKEEQSKKEHSQSKDSERKSKEETKASDSQGNEKDISPDEIYSPEETREKAMEMMEQEKNSISTYSARSRSVSKTAAFINSVSSYAVTVGNKEKLYPSVMIAQAALESAWGTSILAYNPNFNLFGVKGSYQGKTFNKYTKEYSEKNGWEIIKANFRSYPTYAESFNDYAEKIRKGPSSKNSTFYKGVWIENTNSYQDATKWLTGRYATDPKYNVKLNSIINTYNLTKFDKMSTDDITSSEEELQQNLDNAYSDEVVSSKTVNYPAYVNGETDGIYTAPKNTKHSKVKSTAMEYLENKVMIKKEAKTKNGLTWALASLHGKELGWIDKKGLSTFEMITSSKDILYSANIVRGTDSINTRPYGTQGAKRVATSSEYLNKQVNITKEAVTDRATWALISIGRKELGWIDKRALDIEKITDEKNVSYIAALTRGRDNITSKPYGTEDYKIVDKASSYLNQDVKVIKEATTKRATWAFITLNGKELGWIDKRALTQFEQINQTKAAHYLAKVIRGTDSIGSEPYGTNGFKKLGMSSAYLNKQVEIKQEAVTDRATWALLFEKGKKSAGLINEH